jgi:hypothetical protein
MLLIVGAGRSGTHSVWRMLHNVSIKSGHEALHKGESATVGWPFAARCEPTIQSCGWYFPKMGGGRHPRALNDSYALIFKIHRDPLDAIASLERGFIKQAHCTRSRADTFSWRFAGKFIHLPYRLKTTDRTCSWSRERRLSLALYYWVQWNLLSDAHAVRAFKLETLNATTMAREWCSLCPYASHRTRGTRQRGCACPTSARDVAEQKDLPSASSTPKPRMFVEGTPKKRSEPAVTWAELIALDRGMACSARALAEEYGYGYPEELV